jgi:site-specific DNA-methyltransferase (adenine-specific)
LQELVLQGDCLEVLRGLPDNSIDSIVTDPPYGLSKEPNISEVLTKWVAGEPYDHGHGGFMGKAWDSFVPHPDVWKEVYRVLKPGGHALVFAGTRTQDLMTIALRLGGFEIRDVIEWLYFNGFPKSMDVGKAFDRRTGAEREVVGFDPVAARRAAAIGTSAYGDYKGQSGDITSPATDLAKQWNGWGTALKPAHEPIIVARKPLAGTITETVEKYGTGAINIDGGRIGDEHFSQKASDGYIAQANAYSPVKKVAKEYTGRFPANCVTTDGDAFYSPYFNVTPKVVCKKAGKADRGEGNNHPTVKPTELMAWLVRIVTPPGGTVLDPFAGSGSTLVAAQREGFGFVGIEREPEYVEIIKSRVGA